MNLGLRSQFDVIFIPNKQKVTNASDHDLFCLKILQYVFVIIPH